MSWLLFQNSLLVAGATTLVAAVLGMSFSLFAAGLKRPFRFTVATGGAIALILPPFLVSNTWLHYFGLSGTLRWMVDFNIYSLEGTVLLLVLQLWPIPFFFSFAAIQRIDRDYLEQ